MVDEFDNSGADGLGTCPWIIVGCGRLGTTLGLAANRLGVELRTTWNHSESARQRVVEEVDPLAARSGELPAALEEIDFGDAVVWLTVVDDVLLDVAGEMADLLDQAALVVHACGSIEAENLREASIEAPVGGLHPLLAVTDPQSAVDRLSDCIWTVDGDLEAVEFARTWTNIIGARLFELEPGSRAGYHASAATAANLAVALFDAALQMAGDAGIERDEAREMLLPLLRSSVDNLAEQSTAEALSGPAARGDADTITRHRDMLAEADEELLDLYNVLTERALGLGDDKDG